MDEALYRRRHRWQWKLRGMYVLLILLGISALLFNSWLSVFWFRSVIVISIGGLMLNKFVLMVLDLKIQRQIIDNGLEKLQNAPAGTRHIFHTDDKEGTVLNCALRANAGKFTSESCGAYLFIVTKL